MTMDYKTIGQMYQERKVRGYSRKPLRTSKEICAELGISVNLLGVYLHHYNGPKPKLNGRKNANKVLWYDPDEIKAWWGQVKDKVGKVAAKKKREPTITRAYLAQVWIREQKRPVTLAEIVAAGFPSMSGGTRDRMLAYGSIIQKGNTYTATDKDYKPVKGKKNDSRSS